VVIKFNGIIWAGHAARMVETRNTFIPKGGRVIIKSILRNYGFQGGVLDYSGSVKRSVVGRNEFHTRQ
jgi:hypothetical protein